MTVTTTDITSGPYTGTGSTDTYSYTFRVTDKTYLKVYETDTGGIQTLLTVDVDYTVTGVGDDVGGTVVRTAGNLPSGYEWYIKSNYPKTQLTDFESQGGFFPDVHEDALDHLTILIQQLQDTLERSVRVPDGYSGSADTTMPDPVANGVIKWNALGNALEAVVTVLSLVTSGSGASILKTAGTGNLVTKGLIGAGGVVVSEQTNTVTLTGQAGVGSEPYLGLPSVSGQLLSSTTGGVRSWTTASAQIPTSVVILTAASGTYNVPGGTKYMEVECIGGGGGGGGSTGTGGTIESGQGGGSGARSIKFILTPASSYSYTVGAGGAAGAAGANAGGTGGTTSFGSVCIAIGGSGGWLTSVGGSGGNSASCTGDIRIDGFTGVNGDRQGGTEILVGGLGGGPGARVSGLSPRANSGAGGAGGDSGSGSDLPGTAGAAGIIIIKLYS